MTDTTGTAAGGSASAGTAAERGGGPGSDAGGPPRARAAVPADAAELARLRGVMFAAMSGGADGGTGTDGGTAWVRACEDILRTRLADPAGDIAAFVVDAPAHGGLPGGPLAACAVGTVERRLSSPGNPEGLAGHLFNVATDPALRRRGYARACVRALLDWYEDRGVPKVDLHATVDGEPLYASLGFLPTPHTAMRLTL
jgi:ribosomal protein S18 acetylase RimI-like enzyme